MSKESTSRLQAAVALVYNISSFVSLICRKYFHVALTFATSISLSGVTRKMREKCLQVIRNIDVLEIILKNKCNLSAVVILE